MPQFRKKRICKVYVTVIHIKNLPSSVQFNFQAQLLAGTKPMKKTLIAATAAAFAFTAPAHSADLDNDIGLIVSGVVDKWAGLQFIDDSFNDDTVFANGGEGRLSLPLGNNWSVQSDVKYEYNSNALEDPNNNNIFGPRFSTVAMWISVSVRATRGRCLRHCSSKYRHFASTWESGLKV